MDNTELRLAQLEEMVRRLEKQLEVRLARRIAELEKGSQGRDED